MDVKVSKEEQELCGYYEGQVIYLNGDCNKVYLLECLAQEKGGDYMASLRLPQNGDILDFRTPNAIYTNE